ncbi:MAG: hypothetical protein AAGF14_06530 [Pseudomonadota bacterium]
MAEHRQPAVLVAQGTSINRHGRVHITPSGEGAKRILIGGEVQMMIEGTLTF